MLVTVGLNRRYQRDFNREWAESFRVKHRAPLGEDALAKMTRRLKK
jgi:putative membrane protein